MFQLRAQLFAFQQFGHNVRRTFVNAQIVNGQDVRMIERGHGPRFVLEPGQTMRVGGDVGGEALSATSRPSRRSFAR